MRRTNKNSYLIVDGYNIINAWDGLKEISKEDLESAREKLIHYIIEYAQYTGCLLYTSDYKIELEKITVLDQHMKKCLQI